MKTTSLRIMGALVGLGVLWLVVPGVQAEEDWMREAREQREQMDKFNREAQQQREEMDRFNREAQQQREEMDKFNREAQEQRDAFYRDQKAQQQQAEWDQWLNRVAGPGPVAAPPQAPVAIPPQQAPVAGPAGGAAQAPPVGAVPTFRQQFFNGATRTDITYYRDPTGQLGSTSVSVSTQAPAAAPLVNFRPQPVPQDPAAFAQMVRQNQERVRQQILQAQQQIMQHR